MKRKTINIEPDDIEVSAVGDNGKFIITATTDKKRIRLMVPRWYIKYLAEQFHFVILSEQESLDKIKQAMRGE